MELYNNNKMEMLKKIFTSPKEIAVAVSGISLLGMYLLYVRKHVQGENKRVLKNQLSLSLHQLVKQSKPKNTVKIVITESNGNQRQFTSILVTKLKELLLSYDLTTLVNCSPLKLFHSGSQVFVSTLCVGDDEDEDQFMSYYESALRCQLVIERTILDINKIRNESQMAYLICDTNSLDLKVNTDFSLWKRFLTKMNINEQDLINNYQIVFHVITSENSIADGNRKKQGRLSITEDSDDLRISKTWQDFQQYYAVKYDTYLMLEENVENAMEKIVQKLKPFLSEKVVYEKKKIFTKEL